MTQAQKKVSQAKADQELLAARRRAMGNMEFVGHLFKVGMATANMVHTCMQDLLQDPTSEELECACKLFSTAGPHLQVLFSSSYCPPSCCSCSFLGSQSNCCSMLVGHMTAVSTLRLVMWCLTGGSQPVM
jgi:hypothetical protein